MLEMGLNDAGVTVELNTTLTSVNKETDYTLTLNTGTVQCESLVIATGGKSIPKMGATGIGYQIAEQFGLSIIETRPGLVPLTFAHQELAPIKAMAGTSVQARVTCDKTSFEEGLLFTHRGLSGPSILQISSYWREGDEIIVNLARDKNVLDGLKTQRQSKGKPAIHNALGQQIAASVAQFATTAAGVSGNLADQSDQALERLSGAVHAWKIKPVGSEGYRTAEVTIGGVDTNDLDARTLQAKNVTGLFFIGEVVDVTGWLGGDTFQWAWTSGWAAGQIASRNAPKWGHTRLYCLVIVADAGFCTHNRIDVRKYCTHLGLTFGAFAYHDQIRRIARCPHQAPCAIIQNHARAVDRYDVLDLAACDCRAIL
jgi:predicted Rossmann fold flavoprotein